MKLAKTALAILLAALLACGMFAIGASAACECDVECDLCDVCEEFECECTCEPDDGGDDDGDPGDGDPFVLPELPWYVNLVLGMLGIDLSGVESLEDLLAIAQEFLGEDFDLEALLEGDFNIAALLGAIDFGSLIGALLENFNLGALLGNLDLSALLANFSFGSLFENLDFGKIFEGFSGFLGGLGARISAFHSRIWGFWAEFSLIGFILRLIGIDVSIVITI